MSQSNSDYYFYIQSDAWMDRRQKVMQRAGKWCECCGVQAAVDVHHLTYDRLGREKQGDLIAVCRDCHERIHGISDVDPLRCLGSSELIQIVDELSIWATNRNGKLWVDFDELASSLGLDRTTQISHIKASREFNGCYKRLAVIQGGSEVHLKMHIDHRKVPVYLLRIEEQKVSSVIRPVIAKVRDIAVDAIETRFFGPRNKEVDKAIQVDCTSRDLHAAIAEQQQLQGQFNSRQVQINNCVASEITELKNSVEYLSTSFTRVTQRVAVIEDKTGIGDEELTVAAWLEEHGVPSCDQVTKPIGKIAGEIWRDYWRSLGKEEVNIPKQRKVFIGRFNVSVWPRFMIEQAVERFGLKYEITDRVVAASQRQIPSMPLKRIASDNTH